MRPSVTACHARGFVWSVITVLSVQGVLLCAPPPSAGQGATGGHVRDLILTATTHIGDSARETAYAQLAEVEQEDVAQTFRDMLANPDDLPIYVCAGDLVHGLVRCLGEQRGLTILREVLMGAEDGEWPLGVETRRLSAPDTPAGWTLLTDLVGAARSKEVREQAKEALLLLTHRSEALRPFQPSTPLGFYYRGLAYLRRGNGGAQTRGDALDNALADFEQAIALDPALVQAHIQRANALNRLRRYVEAIECLDRVIADNPRHGRLKSDDIGEGVGWAHELRSDAHRALGHEAEAASDLQTAQRLRREAQDVYLQSANGLKEETQRAEGWLLHGAVVRGSWEKTSTFLPKALQHLDNIVRYHPDQALYRLKRGMVHHELGEAAAALADYDAFIAVVPDAPYVQYLRAKALRALRREEEAAQALASYERGIAAFEAPTLPVELPTREWPDPVLGYSDVVGLANAPTENAETLARVLVATGTDGPTWNKAVSALPELDNERLVPLTPYLEQATLAGDCHYPGGYTLLSLLGRAGQASSIPYLLHAVTCAPAEASTTWREKAVEAVGDLPRELAEPALQSLVLAAEDRGVVDCAVRELVELSSESYRQFGVRAILEAPPEYQIRAAQSLGDSLSLLVLLQLARDDGTSDTVRQHAATVLASWPPTAARLSLAAMR